MKAAFNGHAEVVRTLLAAKARPEIRSERGDTAIEMAHKNNHHTVVALLWEDPDAADQDDIVLDIEDEPDIDANTDPHAEVMLRMIKEAAQKEKRDDAHVVNELPNHEASGADTHDGPDDTR